MIWLAFAATWWAGIGLVVGTNRSRWLRGPTDGLWDAALWAIAWPVLWFYEACDGD